MKKLLFIMLALPMLLVSCGNDDLPDVKFSVDYEGGTLVDGVIYVVQGDILEFEGIYVKAVNANHNAAIAGASYFWDYIPAGSTIIEPFGRKFDTSLYAVGAHQVQIKCSVLEEDCAPATALLTFPIMIVSDASEVPGGVDNGGGKIVPRVTLGAND